MTPQPESNSNVRIHRLDAFDDSLTQVPDRELLELFVRGGRRDAMATLIERYGPLVASVCRLTVSDSQSAEDAFQATFLILIQSAAKIRQRDSLAAWLHGVAYRTACRVRKKQLASKHELGDAAVDEAELKASDPMHALARRIDVETLNQELEKLPLGVRAPLVEHYMMGLTAPAIAERMELSISAVEGRIRRGRRTLRQRLARRGISMSIVLAGSSYLQQHVQAAQAEQWSQSFVSEYLSGGHSDGGAASSDTFTSSNPEVSSLVTGELSMINSTLLKGAAAVGIFAVAGTLAVIAAEGPQQDGGGPPASTVVAADVGGTVQAQFGQAQAPAGGGAAGGVPPVALSNQPAATTAGAAAPGGSAEAASVVAWQRPETNGQSPSWLAGGQSAMVNVEKNREVLSELVEANFPGLPLRRVVGDLSEAAGVPITFRRAELESLGVDPDVPVNLEFPGAIPLREALRMMLRDLDLTWVVTESGIEITSIDDAMATTNFRFYDLSYVLPNSAQAESLMHAIQETIEPDSWYAAGGQSTCVMVGSLMIVSAPDSTHQLIEVLLVNVTRMNPSNAAQAPSATASPRMMGGGGGGDGFGGGGGGGGGMF